MDEKEEKQDSGARFGRFRISTMMSWTAVAAIGLTVVAEVGINDLGDIGPAALFFAILLAAATCIPVLVDRLLESWQPCAETKPFTPFWKGWLVVFVGLYSMFMFGLSSIAFLAEWKGHKGLAWFFYTLESTAALTWWPSYMIGGIAFIMAVVDNKLATRSPVVFLMILIQVAISFCYTFACVFMNFATPREFWVVPGSCTICYGLFAAIMFRQRSWSLDTVRTKWAAITATIVAFVAGIVAKYPFAVAYYQELADEPPDNCFIVSAASKGHEAVVKSWYDVKRNRVVNQQLINFWQFEEFLKEQSPAFHSQLRKIYNRVGPVVARRIAFRWQANLVYWLLKPIEVVATILVTVTSK